MFRERSRPTFFAAAIAPGCTRRAGSVPALRTRPPNSRCHTAAASCDRAELCVQTNKTVLEEPTREPVPWRRWTRPGAARSAAAGRPRRRLVRSRRPARARRGGARADCSECQVGRPVHSLSDRNHEAPRRSRVVTTPPARRESMPARRLSTWRHHIVSIEIESKDLRDRRLHPGRKESADRLGHQDGEDDERRRGEQVRELGSSSADRGTPRLRRQLRSTSSTSASGAHAADSPESPVAESVRPPCGVGSNGVPSIFATTTVARDEFQGVALAEVTSVSRSSSLGPYSSSTVTTSVRSSSRPRAAPVDADVMRRVRGDDLDLFDRFDGVHDLTLRRGGQDVRSGSRSPSSLNGAPKPKRRPTTTALPG